MLKRLKRGTLATLRNTGVFRAALDSAWRRNRLLILCYHGISINDEHEWDPAYYMNPAQFESRLRILRDGGYSVLRLDDAISRLYAGTLPPRSVVLTFDDGLADFALRAMPVLRKFGFPATVYLSTYYCLNNKPVYPMFCSYVLWRARGQTIYSTDVLDNVVPEKWSLATADARTRVWRRIVRHANEHQLSADKRDAIARRLVRAVGADYDDLVAQRIIHLLTPDEVTRLSAEGIDFQLHTHRHQTPLDRRLFAREIADNRAHLSTLAGSAPAHFCYPSGIYRKEFLPWLNDAGIVSATTCDAGLASPRSRALLLPRVIDTGHLTDVEFEGWLTGVGGMLPHRRHVITDL